MNYADLDQFLAAQDTIESGDFIAFRGIPFRGWVVGTATIGKVIDAYKVDSGGRDGLIPFDEAVLEAKNDEWFEAAAWWIEQGCCEVGADGKLIARD